MDSTRWDEIKRIFGAALELPAGDRAGFVRERCRGDLGLESEVLSLLDEVREGDSDTLERPAAALLPELAEDQAEASPRQVGPYHVLRLIGQGGMGSVYEAERDDEYRKRVAVKLIRSGATHSEVLRRFQHERQILAGLSHPNIAVLLDGGVTDDGAPWFAMEYVDGQPVDVYCDERGLDLGQRLQLFREICGAVSFAHRNLIIHRDLKPSNILVTADGVVKLLDFGIAKLLGEDGDPGPGLTRTGYYLVTPEYASPEQLSGLPASTATDVYSLGVLLYRLLTGRQPHEVAGLPLPAASRIVCEEEPRRPSSVVADAAAVRRGAGTARRLGRMLAGDVDAMVLKAMRREPELRYTSVEALAADITRYLEGRAVLARRGSRAYHAHRFLLRHRWAMGGSALLLLTLAGGVVSTLSQAQRAERRFAEVRELANTFLFDFHDAIATLPGSTPARELVVSTALEYLDRLTDDAQSDPDLLADLAQAYSRVGDVQGNPETNNLGRTGDALESYRRALALAERLVEIRPGDPVAERILSVAHIKIGDMLTETGDLTGAAEHYLVDLGISEARWAQSPEEATALGNLRFSLNKLAQVYARVDRAEEALELDRRALEVAQREIDLAPGDPEALRSLMVAHNRVADRIHASGEFAASLEGYLAARDIARDLAERDALNDVALRDLTVSHFNIATAHYNLEAYREALEGYEAMAEVNERRAAADPASVTTRRDLAFSRLQVAETYSALGAADSAFAVAEDARRVYEALAAEYPAITDFQRDLASAHVVIAGIVGPNDPSLAETHRGRAVALLRELSERDPANAQFRGDLARLIGDGS